MDIEVARRDIIVIGGSAGATAPLKTLLASLPADCTATIFIVLHIPARSTGILATVASSVAHLPVSQAQDRAPYLPGHIYLAVPDRHLLLVDGCMRLGGGPRENMARPAIDPLFRSAAIAHGPRVVGVLLSGLLNDGSSGMVAIKRCGGIGLVQDPADAIAREMPRSAMQAAQIDFAVPAALIGDTLCELMAEPAGWPVPVPPDLRLEVDIAAGERLDSGMLQELADPAPLTCPACGGVMSTVRGAAPLRYRCQVGHAMTAEVMAKQQESAVDEALRIALRVIEERAELVQRMAREATAGGRSAVADTYAERAQEYRHYADTLRAAVMAGLEVDAQDPTDPSGLDDERS